MPKTDDDDQKAELTKIKSDPRYSTMKRLVKVCMDDILDEGEQNKPPNKNDDSNIFDDLAGFFSGKN